MLRSTATLSTALGKRPALVGPLAARCLRSSDRAAEHLATVTTSPSTSTLASARNERQLARSFASSCSAHSPDTIPQVPQSKPALAPGAQNTGASSKPSRFMSPAAVAAATRATDRPYRRERRMAQKAQRKQTKRDKAANTIFAKAGVATNRFSAFVRTDQQFKTFKPLTHSLRWVRHLLQPDLHKGKPERALTIAKRATAGRNSSGKIVVRGRGGGHKRRLRIVDFHRSAPGEQNVLRIEYDPGRSAHIALIEHSQSKLKSYILAPYGLRAGDIVESFRCSDDVPGAEAGSSTLDIGIFRTKAIRPGNVLQLHLIPIGTSIHNLSLTPHGPAKLIRSAGSVGQLVAFVKRSKSSPVSSSLGQPGGDVHSAFDLEQNERDRPQQDLPTHAQVKLQSGEVRLVPIRCHATVGRVSNPDHEHIRLGKAGRSRWLGIKPKVRGVAMNAIDHPHGGGRGKSKSNMHPKSIHGWKTEGRTRKPGTRTGNRMVIRERPRQNGKRRAKGPPAS